ncbi:AlbA family DNA-binding domain-containing protein [Arthrobacter sp. Leaf141]|uniref:AlbA family DNA-binding domain-containing protein n=1 Tax=Arthrobacter sp. Leaf141 TaxID=1736273 RepID=UPI001F47237A|nr:ATP-binding protein [Arthrobacter sp. Leaf141]
MDEAVKISAVEMHDLDWKSQLPQMKGLSQTDFPKDVAAMANNGGGLIVYGVNESQKAATDRADVGHFDEGYERALRSAAITAISPPVFGLKVHRLGTEAAQNRAVVVEIAASVDGPHLIYRNELFGAPIRNDSDTVWMKERQIEAMYRARLDERRQATAALDALFNDSSAGRNTGDRAWFIAVAHPRVPRILAHLDRDEARLILQKAVPLALSFAGRGGVHPLESVDVQNPRPGLRRWVAVNTATGERKLWREAWVSVHQNGSVTLATAIGAHQMSRDGYFAGHEVEARAIECAVADFMALTRITADSTGNDGYDVRAGIDWTGTEPLQIMTIDNSGFVYKDVSTPLHRFTPVETSLDARETDAKFRRSVYELARDCVNQGGISNLHLIAMPD